MCMHIKVLVRFFVKLNMHYLIWYNSPLLYFLFAILDVHEKTHKAQVVLPAIAEHGAT